MLLIGEDKEAETETVMRVILKKVLEEKTSNEKYRVALKLIGKLQLPKEHAQINGLLFSDKDAF